MRQSVCLQILLNFGERACKALFLFFSKIIFAYYEKISVANLSRIQQKKKFYAQTKAMESAQKQWIERVRPTKIPGDGRFFK